MSKNIYSVCILGSTSEISKYLALDLFKKGCKRFHLMCRDSVKNQEINEVLFNKKSIKITEEYIDCSDIQNQTNSNILKTEKFDLYFVAVGALFNKDSYNSRLEEIFDITSSNYLGIIRYLEQIINKHKANIEGKLWVISSVAGDRGRPSNNIYGAAKSALSIFCEGEFIRHIKTPFSIRIIKAGFIDTKMSRGIAPKSLCVSPINFAKYLIKTKNKRGVEYFPFWWKYIMLIIKLLPAKMLKGL